MRVGPTLESGVGDGDAADEQACDVNSSDATSEDGPAFALAQEQVPGAWPGPREQPCQNTSWDGIEVKLFPASLGGSIRLFAGLIGHDW